MDVEISAIIKVMKKLNIINTQYFSWSGLSSEDNRTQRLRYRPPNLTGRSCRVVNVDVEYWKNLDRTEKVQKVIALFQLTSLTTEDRKAVITFQELLLLILVYLFYKIVFNPVIQLLYYKLKYGSQIAIYYYPLLGLIKLQQNGEKYFNHPYAIYGQIIKKNPQVKAIVGNLGASIVIQMLHPLMIKGVTVDNYKCYEKFVPLFNIQSIQNSILFTEGEKWKYQRHLISPSFSFESLKSRLQLMKDTTNEYIEKMKDKALTQTPLRISEEMMQISGEMGVRSFFGTDFSKKTLNQRPITLELGSLVDSLVKYSNSSIFYLIKRVIYGVKASLHLQTQYEKELLRRSDAFIQLTKDTIDKKIEDSQKGITLSNDIFIDILVNCYLKQQQDKEQDPIKIITKEEIIQQSLGMYVAALDNTGGIMAMCLYCLAKYKEQAKKVVEEIDQLIKQPQDLQLEHFNKMEYTTNFIKETFRLYSSSGGIFLRKVLKSHFIQGIEIKKNMLCWATWYGPFSNPEIYPNPEKFDPERWVKQDYEATFRWTPFSAGPRNCIGQHMSMIEIKIVICYLIKNFELFLNEEVELKLRLGLIVHPLDDRLIKLKIRQ